MKVWNFESHRLVEDKEFNTISSVILKKIVPMALSTFIMLVKFFWQDSSEEKQPLEVEMQEFGRCKHIRGY